MQPSDVPYFSQWETADMTSQVLAEGPLALLRDPLWRNSGAETIEEYARWAVNVCGMACLKMILAARGECHPILSLARVCTDYGGYVVNQADASIKGLIYDPFVTFVRERFGLLAETRTSVATTEIPGILTERQFFIASVNSGIRWPHREPPSKGGHLVLVTAASPDTIRFHNPSGHDQCSQANVTLPLDTFDLFFANRGIALSWPAEPASPTRSDRR
ncbi:C39 family peptidase [Mesorhizobium sp. BAC0120]|uniref:C39 family peptidase n=1 Tax=Mesorhizobium sp. BAC0120 TaxID=3090670 RepID=UPI00298D3397|nr:C39 family peptidase [Mesorhizobium sp. BAC0120]MDW6021996.1 C39 family peptidase [Mesorhizobium sp. BAC0120]